jgi:hypothetical protein
MAKIIEIRKLAAVDMVWLGTPVIIAEYALGVGIALVLGMVTLRAGLSAANPSTWQVALGAWLVTIALNCVSLLLYAVSMARSRTVKAEGKPELTHARRYGTQQAIILIPFAVIILAIYQERNRRKAVS